MEILSYCSIHFVMHCATTNFRKMLQDMCLITLITVYYEATFLASLSLPSPPRYFIIKLLLQLKVNQIGLHNNMQSRAHRFVNAVAIVPVGVNAPKWLKDAVLDFLCELQPLLFDKTAQDGVFSK